MNDYISRAEFVRKLDDIIARCNQTGVTDDFQYHELVGEENATKAIRCLAKAFPPADVRPVKEGAWMPIIEGNEYGEAIQIGCYCSQCGEQLQSEPDYCPNCGAKMGGNT